MDYNYGNGRDYNAVNNNPYEEQYSGYIATIPPTEPERPIMEPHASGSPPKKRRGGVRFVAMFLALLLIGGAGGYAGSYLYSELNTPAEIVTEEQSGIEDGKTAESNGGDTGGTASSALKTFSADSSSMTASEIYEQNVQSVVAIRTESTYTNIFRQTSTYASSGTGFILTEDGYILTNNHVIDGASTVTVTLYDGTSYTGTVIGADEVNDIAVLYIEAANLNPVNLGDSDSLIVGESVVAIGNPLGELTNTLTSGVVSAVDRLINIDGTPINMFQIDAAVNSGNSGGPVFDSTGRVVGVVTAKYSDSTVEGLGFAIPINDAISVAESLVELGYVPGRPALNIMVETMDAASAAYYGVPVGVYVNTVIEGGSGEAAGLQAGDIITRLGNYEITSTTDLDAAKLKYSAGDTAELEVYRNGSYIMLTITFSELQTGSSSGTTDSSGSGDQGGQTPSGRDNDDLQGDFPPSNW